jgi:hypothetical protein
MSQRKKPIEVRPAFVLSAEVYLEWREAGHRGERNLAGAIDQAALDLIEKHRIVVANEADLRGWLNACVKCHFMLLFIGKRVPQEEARKRWTRIDAAFQILSNELPKHYLSADFDPYPSRLRLVGEVFRDQISFIHKHARATYEFNRSFCKNGRARNAAKGALKPLGNAIRSGWVRGWGGPQQVPLIEAGSKYVQFATYIYAFLGEGRSERMIINRLKAADHEARKRERERPANR